MKRKYTGWNSNATGKLAGTEEFAAQMAIRTNNAVWNLGTFGIRLKRDKSTPSVHSTGRAGDSSYRHVPHVKGIRHGRPVANKMFNRIVENADLFGLELVIDYQYGAFGRSYRCDRIGWKVYAKSTVYGGGFADWYHWELSPKYSTNPILVAQAFEKVFGPLPRFFRKLRLRFARL